MVQLQDKLSDHFKFYEAVHSDTAFRLGINNVPADEEIIAALKYHSKGVLEPIRKEFGAFSPLSWYRGEVLERTICQDAFLKWCKKRNYQASEAAWELYFMRKSHPKGEAADIRIPGVSNHDLYNFIVDNLEYDQVILEFVPENNPFAGWVHVSSIDEGAQRKNRMQAFNIS